MAQPLAFTKSTTQVSCLGTPGAASVSVTGGLAPYNYEWRVGNGPVFSTNAAVTNLSNGTYFVTVTDANSFSITDSIVLHSEISGYLYNTVAANCPLANGEAVAYITGGNGPYTYSWSNGSTTATATNLAADAVIQVQAKDADGCDVNFYDYSNQPPTFSTTGTITIQSISSITATISTLPEQCPLNNGSISLTNTNGGTAPYTYYWNTTPAQLTPTITSLASGSYQVKITDATGCSSTLYPYVNLNPGSLSVAITKTNDYCERSIGTATITISGGAPPYTTVWPDGTNSLYKTNLSYGFHTVSITDQNNCVVNQQVFIDNYTPVIASISTTNTNCTNTSGTATVNVNGGVAPYTYLWNTGASTPSIAGLPKNYYSILVKDATNCPARAWAQVSINNNCYGYISGKVFQDNNGNCIQESGEYPIMNTWMYMNAANSSLQLYDSYYSTRLSGNYTMRYVLPDQYTVTADDLPVRSFECPSTGVHAINIPTSGVDYPNTDFAMLPKSLDEDVALLYNCRYSEPRPGFSYTYSLSYKNVGTLLSDGFIEMAYADLESFVSSSPIPDFIDPVNRVLRYNYANLMLGEIRSIEITYAMPATTLLGTTYNHILRADIGNTDPTPLNNERIEHFTVVGSYDPNDIRVSPTDLNVEEDTLLFYTIRFQNTGTYPAELVVVKDTLEANLDIDAIQNIVASHPYKFQLLDNRVAEFAFENINLPDSTRNEKESHGFVSYTIKRKKGLVAGTELLNQADIYFDYNEPVITNTAKARIMSPTSTIEKAATVNGNVFPNPAKDYADFTFEKGISSIKILNASGVVVIEEVVDNQKQFRLSLSLAKGLYFFNALNANGNLYSGKILID
jgi:hypothetical protein